ncbi:MAG: serine hydrolase, partial [Alphaproteobacteria bacterium]|nr:serine hydrolase [Alphaproteobacteria bacterium]
AEGDPDCGEEVGACVSVVVEGERVVDLWGGYRDAARAQLWQPDTITCMMSVTKACASICLLTLVDRGAIDLEQWVAHYWPAFSANGKDTMTVRTLISHQSGVIFADAAPAGSLWQEGVVEQALEEATPEWPPGSAGSYHSFTYGPLVSGLIRHVDGRTVGRFWREEIAEPFDLEFHIGLEDAEVARCAEFIETPGTPSRDGIKVNPDSPLFRAWAPMPKDEDFNSDDWFRGEFASANGHGNARAIATLYGGLVNGGEIGGKRLLSEAVIKDAIAEHWDDMDRMTNRHFRFGCGFMLSCPPFPFGGRRDNFGHTGIGGAVGFGDPHARLGFSYCGNRMAPIADMGPFATPMVDAMYASIV